MSLLDVLYRLIIYPLELLFEVIFAVSERLVNNPELSIIILSVVVNLLVLPLYRRADAMQEREREMAAKMAPWLKHIRKTFKGDERFMMTQTYYRQMGYKQVYVLRSSVPLLLQIPFFIAAYHFLSHLDYISGVRFGPIKDLAEPDALIAFGGITLNLLPILMTAINAASATVYSKGFPIKTKIQMYGIAAIFLVLLYNSPAGLVFYWTLNNLFSLGKNIVMKMVHEPKPKKTVKVGDDRAKADNAIWFLGALNLTVLTGILIPAGTIASSPLEFLSFEPLLNPLKLIVLSALTACGVFIIWFGVFYLLAARRTRSFMALGMLMLNAFTMINVFFSGESDLRIYPDLVFVAEYHKTSQAIMMNLLSLFLAAILVYIFWNHYVKAMAVVLALPLLALSVMSYLNVKQVQDGLEDKYFLDEDYNYFMPADIKLSTNGKNVVVIMLDWAIGEYIPYIMANNPGTADQYDGFTYYPNTLSYGPNTIFGAPALFGGIEYSAENMNLRRDLSLAYKTDESLKVMPLMFLENSYDVTVVNPPNAGYKWIPDLSIYDGYDVDAYVTNGAFCRDNEEYVANDEALRIRQERNLFCSSVSKMFPPIMTDFFYDDGDFNAIEYGDHDRSYGHSLYRTFMDAYRVLLNMDKMTTITEDPEGGFLMMANDTAHELYRISDESYPDGLYAGEDHLVFANDNQIKHYQVTEAAITALGHWFDYLREKGVYDNTRIIIVSDHGAALYQDSNMIQPNGLDMMAYNPVLMIHDFGEEGYNVCEDYMTNAVVPYYATLGVVDEQVNPLTGNELTLDFLTDDPVIIYSEAINSDQNPGNTYAPADWYRLSGVCDTLDGGCLGDLQIESIPIP